MKQALHIFLKDVQRLWIQIALLMMAIGYFAWLDINESAFDNGNANSMVQFLVGVMVWFLIARTVHEEPMPGEDQFWLTRPYERGSLLSAKILMALCIVIVPLFVADCVILSAKSLGTIGNLGGLVLKQLLTVAWLILPPLAIASVTSRITEDVLAWLVVFGVSTFYFPRNWGTNEFQAAKEYEIAFALLLLVLALWLQYFRRGTIGGRSLIVAAVLLPALPIPEFAAMAVAQLRNDPAVSAVQLPARPGAGADVNPMVVHSYGNYYHCAPIDVSVQGAAKGWRLEVLSQKDTFESGDKTWSMGWREIGVGWGHFNHWAISGTLNACATPEGAAELGSGNPLTVHTSVVLGIFANDPVTSVRAQWEPFDVPGIGRCQFQHYLQAGNYMLTCADPLRFPPQGSVDIGTDTAGAEISNYRPSFAPLKLLPGFSPVYKWTTLAMGNQIQQTVAAGGQIEFRPESRIAVIERELTVKDVHLQ